MQSRIGFNFHGDAPNVDRAKFTAIQDRLRPRWQIIMNDLSYAKELAARYGETNFITRWTPKDDNPLESWPDPTSYVDFVEREFGGARLWACTANEAGMADELVNWHIQVIERGVPRGLRFAILGLSSGTPANTEDWKRPAVRKLLELCHKYRENVVILLHEYFAGVCTSGYIDGNPAFIQSDSWPKKTEDVVMWHCGRFKFLLEACDWMAISYPRIVLGEHGADDMSDIKPWLEQLIRTPPYQNIRSWKSLWNQWRVWWPRWTPDRAYAEQLIYLDRYVYRDSPVEGQLMFAWNSPSAKWEAFDVSQANELHGLLEAYASEGVPTASPPRRYAPGVYTCADTTPFNIRALPTTSAGKQGSLMPGDTVKALDVDAAAADGLIWQRFEVTPKAAGNLLITGWIAVTDLDLTPKVTEPPAPPPDVVLQFSKAELLTLATAHDTAATSHQTMAALYRQLAAKAA